MTPAPTLQVTGQEANFGLRRPLGAGRVQGPRAARLIVADASLRTWPTTPRRVRRANPGAGPDRLSLDREAAGLQAVRGKLSLRAPALLCTRVQAGASAARSATQRGAPDHGRRSPQGLRDPDSALRVGEAGGGERYD